MGNVIDRSAGRGGSRSHSRRTIDCRRGFPAVGGGVGRARGTVGGERERERERLSCGSDNSRSSSSSRDGGCLRFATPVARARAPRSAPPSARGGTRALLRRRRRRRRTRSERIFPLWRARCFCCSFVSCSPLQTRARRRVRLSLLTQRHKVRTRVHALFRSSSASRGFSVALFSLLWERCDAVFLSVVDTLRYRYTLSAAAVVERSAAE